MQAGDNLFGFSLAVELFQRQAVVVESPDQIMAVWSKGFTPAIEDLLVDRSGFCRPALPFVNPGQHFRIVHCHPVAGSIRRLLDSYLPLEDRLGLFVFLLAYLDSREI